MRSYVRFSPRRCQSSPRRLPSICWEKFCHLGRWRFRRRRTLIPKGTRTAFRAEGERFSERSDAGTAIVPEVFGFVKENLSGAVRSAAKEDASSGERGAGKG